MKHPAHLALGAFTITAMGATGALAVVPTDFDGHWKAAITLTDDSAANCDRLKVFEREVSVDGGIFRMQWNMRLGTMFTANIGKNGTVQTKMMQNESNTLYLTGTFSSEDLFTGEISAGRSCKWSLHVSKSR